MKAKLLTLVVCFGMFAAVPFALFADDVAISFDYERQSDRATNQFAVWIEDTNGNVVKPLFVTKFTGNGGWERRPDSLPKWVESVAKGVAVDATSGSTPDADTEAEAIDTMSGSTPQSGKMEYIWDGTDTKGKTVPDGTYVFFVESSFRWANRALFEGRFELDGNAFSVKATPEYFGDDDSDRGMIENVTATFVK